MESLLTALGAFKSPFKIVEGFAAQLVTNRSSMGRRGDAAVLGAAESIAELNQRSQRELAAAVDASGHIAKDFKLED